MELYNNNNTQTYNYNRNVFMQSNMIANEITSKRVNKIKEHFNISNEAFTDTKPSNKLEIKVNCSSI